MRDVLQATDRWFVRRGLPHAIREYSATEDVWTRAWPFLLFVLFVELFASFGDRFSGWAQAGAFLVGLGLVAGGFVVVNLIRRRRPLRRPDDIGVPELTVFVLAPAVLPFLSNRNGVPEAIAIVIVNLVVLAIVYPVTSYGLVPAIRVGLVQAFRQLRTVTQLVARGLPFLLLITTFVFLNAEMWQVAHDFSPAYFAICVTALVLLAFAFLALRVPREAAELARFDSWDAVRDLASETDAPIVRRMPPLEGVPAAPRLGRVESWNVGLLLTISQVVQTLLVGLGAALFFVAFGLLAVRKETIVQWTVADDVDAIVSFGFLGDELVLTWELLAVASFVGAFSVLQFAVASVTDAAYREEFYDDVAAEVRQVLAVRAIVRAVGADPATPTPVSDDGQASDLA